MKDKILICGDLHGNIKQLINDNQNILKNSDLVCVGDFGVGFGKPNSMKVIYSEIENKIKELDLDIYTIRGNHDNPGYFDGQHNFEHLIFLEDHKVFELQGKTFYPIGGATSIDLDRPDPEDHFKTRRQKNSDYIKYGSSKRCWWEDECTKKVYKDLPYKVDYIISHEAPVSFLPVPIRSEDILDDTWKNVMDDRNYLESLVSEINASRWFYGHYHRSYSGHVGDLLYKCLGINELFELYG